MTSCSLALGKYTYRKCTNLPIYTTKYHVVVGDHNVSLPCMVKHTHTQRPPTTYPILTSCHTPIRVYNIQRTVTKKNTTNTSPCMTTIIDQINQSSYHHQLIQSILIPSSADPINPHTILYSDLSSLLMA